MEATSKSLEDTRSIAEKFAMETMPLPDEAVVIGLYGDLGAGKTTFMKYFAEAFGITETIQSPTFVIEKVYDLENKRFAHLVHIDAYRIEKDTEMLNLGWREMLKDKGNLICVEWPERIMNIMPRHTQIEFEHIDEEKRKITIR